MKKMVVEKVNVVASSLMKLDCNKVLELLC